MKVSGKEVEESGFPSKYRLRSILVQMKQTWEKNKAKCWDRPDITVTAIFWRYTLVCVMSHTCYCGLGFV